MVKEEGKESVKVLLSRLKAMRVAVTKYGINDAMKDIYRLAKIDLRKRILFLYY